jgi:hypothetical protein
MLVTKVSPTLVVCFFPMKAADFPWRSNRGLPPADFNIRRSGRLVYNHLIPHSLSWHLALEENQ